MCLSRLIQYWSEVAKLRRQRGGGRGERERVSEEIKERLVSWFASLLLFLLISVS